MIKEVQCSSPSIWPLTSTKPSAVTLPTRDGITQYTLLFNSALDDVEVTDHAPGSTLPVAATSLQLFRAH